MRSPWIWLLACGLVLSSCEGSPTLPPQVQAAGRVTPSPSVSSTPCRETGPLQEKILSRDALWKRHLDKLASGHSVGIAVGLNGTFLYEHDAHTKRTPASNEKLMLSMALFDQLGPAYRIDTTAAVRPPMRNGIVKGDLWILGGGDPTLTQKQQHFWGPLASPTLEELAQRIDAAGIEHVQGAVRGATDFFTHDFDAPGWQPYVPRNYVELAAALSLNGNFHVHGKPEQVAARTLQRQIGQHGIEVDGASSAGKAPPGLSPIAKVRSAPLADIVAFMDQTSNNYFAEMLGKLLGAETYGAPGTIRKGARAIALWTQRYGVKNAVYDSSGLSYRDKVSPHDLVTLLSVAERRPWGRELRHDLPVPGQGTLEGRLAGSVVHAKTGTLFNSDSALTGWVREGVNGPWVEFSILDQGMPKSLEDRMVRVIATAGIKASKPRSQCH